MSPAARPTRSATLTSEEVERARDEILRWQAIRSIPTDKIFKSPATWSQLVKLKPMRATTLRQADDALSLERGSLERVARSEGKAVDLTDRDRTLVIQLPGGQQRATVREVWLIAGRLSSAASDLPPEVRGRVKTVVEELIADYEQRRDS